MNRIEQSNFLKNLAKDDKGSLLVNKSRQSFNVLILDFTLNIMDHAYIGILIFPMEIKLAQNFSQIL